MSKSTINKYGVDLSTIKPGDKITIAKKSKYGSEQTVTVVKTGLSRKKLQLGGWYSKYGIGDKPGTWIQVESESDQLFNYSDYLYDASGQRIGYAINGTRVVRVGVDAIIEAAITDLNYASRRNVKAHATRALFDHAQSVVAERDIEITKAGWGRSDQAIIKVDDLLKLLGEEPDKIESVAASEFAASRAGETETSDELGVEFVTEDGLTWKVKD